MYELKLSILKLLSTSSLAWFCAPFIFGIALLAMNLSGDPVDIGFKDFASIILIVSTFSIIMIPASIFYELYKYEYLSLDKKVYYCSLPILLFILSIFIEQEYIVGGNIGIELSILIIIGILFLNLFIFLTCEKLLKRKYGTLEETLRELDETYNGNYVPNFIGKQLLSYGEKELKEVFDNNKDLFFKYKDNLNTDILYEEYMKSDEFKKIQEEKKIEAYKKIQEEFERLRKENKIK